MTYLGRPVFEFAVDWSDAPSRRWKYELSEALIGHGTRVYAPLQKHVMEGWTLQVTLASEAAIQAYEDFTAGLFGRLQGFWLPTPMAGMTIAAGVSGTQFDIRDQGLRDTWESNAGQYLFFRKEGETSQAAKITAVALSGSLERVTVDATVTVDETWEVLRLVYVRLASDDEEAECIAEGWQQRSVRVEELTAEYAAVETGQKPVWLYHFWSGSGALLEEWFFTSFAAEVTSNLGGALASAEAFTAAPITHGRLTRSLKAEREDTTIKTWWQEGNPLQKFLPFDLIDKLWVTIYETTYADPHTVTAWFRGEVQKPTLVGNEISAQCVGWLDALGRAFPRMMIGPRCNNFVFDGRCGLDREAYKVEVTIDAINSDQTTMTLSGAGLAGLEADRFTYGWIVTETGEKRTILSSGEGSGTMVLRINVPFRRTMAGQTAEIFPGCDGVINTCMTKYDNRVNFAGHPYIVKNLTVQALEPETANGNKK